MDIIGALSINGQKVTLDKGHIILKPNEKITYIYFLIKGTVDHFNCLDHPREDVLIYRSNITQTPIGWCGLFPPARSLNKIIIASEEAVFQRFEIEIFQKEIKLNLQNILLKLSKTIFNQYLEVLKSHHPEIKGDHLNAVGQRESYQLIQKDHFQESLMLIKRSPFLGEMDDLFLEKLVKKLSIKSFPARKKMYRQENTSQGIYILINGEVSIERSQLGISQQLRTLSTPGFVWGWEGLIHEKNVASAVTVVATQTLFIAHQEVQLLVAHDPQLTYQLYMRLLWMMDNQLQLCYSRFLKTKLRHDQLTIHNLIKKNSVKLKVGSRLHQVPHLLTNQDTRTLAFQTLSELNTAGDAQERHLSSISLDLLKQENRDFNFYQGLINIYQEVTENTSKLSSFGVRKACASRVIELFRHVDFHIEGWENLPNESGHIFIYNHLINHESYTLPNDFQITLDSHFLSAMILDVKYDDPGIRIVRIPDDGEYGHQNYYQNQGHIKVYASSENTQSKTDKKLGNPSFYEVAGKLLSENQNLIISPEGKSYTTETSPGTFKTGAFKLALQQKNEPYIVPIVLRDFDRRMAQNKVKCKILKPFKISDFIDNNENQLEVIAFVNNYQKQFKKEVINMKDQFK